MVDLSFGDGVLYFPVTPFDAHDRVDAELMADIVGERLAYRPGGVFAACGTGEFHALSVAEHAATVATAVTAAAGTVPVLAGTGGPLGHARACVDAAAEAGADGLLVMPPYLVNAPQRGILSYVEDLAARTELPLIVYHRANARLTADTVSRLLDLERVVGIKDGVGDVAAMQEFVRVAAESGRDITFFNGLLTAELSQSAYRAIGVQRYSSAAFAMAPDVAVAFHRALETGDDDLRDRLLDGFFRPLVHLRDEVPGFAVALVKAGTRLHRPAVGPVRPPLTDPDAAQTDRLARILDAGLALLS